MSELEQARAKQFSERMVGVLNDGFLALMTSIGHQTGLFDGMAKLAPSTSTEIADACDLNERYVREWLGAMVVGEIVEYDAAAGTFYFPPEHAASLTRAAGAANIATTMQFLSCMGEVEDPIARCFREGGGLPYSAYERFHKIMVGVSGPIRQQTLIPSTLPLVSGLVDRLRQGIDVLDVGCGSGNAINLMAREFPASRFTGYDFSAEAVAAGTQEACDWGLTNARFACQDVEHLPDKDAYDFITAFDSIHDQAAPRTVLRQISRALRDDGDFLMVDIHASSHLEKNMDKPLAPYMYSISTMHCMSVSLGLDGEGLGAMWGEEMARELLGEAGFAQVEVRQVKGDVFNNFYICRKD